MNLVSIVIPVYNAEDTLEECVNSVLKQTYKNLEIIIINDGSKDNSHSIMEKLAEKYSNVTYYSQVNKGVSSARNLGLKMAHGDYISFLDSDDYFQEDFVSTYLSIFEANQVDAVFGKFKYLYDEKIVKTKTRLNSGVYNFDRLSNILIDDGTLTGILFGSASTAMYNRRFLDSHKIFFEEGLKVNEDGLFNILTSYHARSIAYNSELENYIYRQSTDKEMVNKSKNTEFYKVNDILKNVHDEVNFKEFNIQMKRRQISIAFWQILDLSVNNVLPSVEIKKSINEILDGVSESNYGYIDYKKISWYKRIIVELMKRKKINLLFYLLNKLIPKLQENKRR